MTRVNLNARRAARASARGEAMVVELADQQFTLAPEMPFFALERIEGNDMFGAVKMLVHPDDWDRFRQAAPTMNDIVEIVEAYGVTLGESLASADSSPNGGGPSRQTSTASTG